MTQPTSEAPTRAYRSARRAEQAAQTRAAVLASAARLFAQQGWSATGMRDVAREAGVAVETVYASFRSKAGLLTAALDVEVVGDAEPVPLADRQQFAALATGGFDERVASAARLVTEIHERTAGLHLALRQGAASEPGLAEALAAGEQRRRNNVQQAAELVAGQPVDAAEVDALWAVLSVDVFRLLTAMSGWSLEQYQRWAAGEIARRLPGSAA